MYILVEQWAGFLGNHLKSFFFLFIKSFFFGLFNNEAIWVKAAFLKLQSASELNEIVQLHWLPTTTHQHFGGHVGRSSKRELQPGKAAGWGFMSMIIVDHVLRFNYGWKTCSHLFLVVASCNLVGSSNEVWKCGFIFTDYFGRTNFGCGLAGNATRVQFGEVCE